MEFNHFSFSLRKGTLDKYELLYYDPAYSTIVRIAWSKSIRGNELTKDLLPGVFYLVFILINLRLPT